MSNWHEILGPERIARRREGKNGYYKNLCAYSPTGWAWWNLDSEERESCNFPGHCTCKPCTPPLDAKDRIAKIKERAAEALKELYTAMKTNGCGTTMIFGRTHDDLPEIGHA